MTPADRRLRSRETVEAAERAAEVGALSEAVALFDQAAEIESDERSGPTTWCGRAVRGARRRSGELGRRALCRGP